MASSRSQTSPNSSADSSPLEGLNIEVKELSIHSVIGPNGAGKTTLFNCITGFYRPEIGDIGSITVPWWDCSRIRSCVAESPGPIRTSSLSRFDGHGKTSWSDCTAIFDPGTSHRFGVPATRKEGKGCQ